ncbi:LytTR family transcriptional regulator [Cellulophaga sp. F20128]|uniref:LytR/AlgR family response regulator transcription factor n=1 Tax=Cellulophaga sp. F20128 TaxID=2926413 RepID=UPI001FF2A5DC|nr:LytTR family DNA-binding domain-containing protein [Cellulophaga sp. F20128]MCK0156823.1 LytTR family transcriptional regulator [Cellulophaga sp. F20128]
MGIQKLNRKLLYPSYGLLVLFCLIVYGLAIFQDFVFSKIQFTGFYWPDTMLYNTYWLLFIPLLFLANRLYQKFHPKTLATKILYVLGTALVFCVVHIFLFTSLFILASHIIYPVPHRFITILKNVLSNHLYHTLIAYVCSPFVVDYLQSKTQDKQFPIAKSAQSLTIKNGTRRLKVDMATIVCIKADRPYAMLYTTTQKILSDDRLKKLESLLDAEYFLRVHRSLIVNKNHIRELKSRKNGDYDGLMSNGQSVRLSRHYRENWKEVLNHLG